MPDVIFGKWVTDSAETIDGEGDWSGAVFGFFNRGYYSPYETEADNDFFIRGYCPEPFGERDMIGTTVRSGGDFDSDGFEDIFISHGIPWQELHNLGKTRI